MIAALGWQDVAVATLALAALAWLLWRRRRAARAKAGAVMCASCPGCPPARATTPFAPAVGDGGLVSISEPARPDR
jgi:hypothetical protein